MEIFCRKLIKNYSEFFKKEYKMETYPNQSVLSCLCLIAKCIEINPDYVIDIGTNYGASTLSLAYALKKLGKDLSCLITIDKELSYWAKTISEVQNKLMGEYDINPCRINMITADFKDIDPLKIIKSDSKNLLFYDIHDVKDVSFFDWFIKNWVPLLKGSIIGIHDASLVPKNFQYQPAEKEDPDYPHVLAHHYSGKTVSGYSECNVIIDWLNDIKKDFYSVKDTSIIFIEL
jgi:hypothetical protein